MRNAIGFCCWLLVGCAGEQALPGPEPSLSIDEIIEIRHPSRPTWSPDGSRLAFVWDDAGVQNVYVVSAEAASEPVALTSYEDGVFDFGPYAPSPLWWESDASIALERAGTLWRIAPDGSGEPQAVIEGGGGFVPSPDGGRIAFSRDGDLWVHAVASGESTQLTDTEAIESSPAWSPSGTRLAFVVNETERHDETLDYVGAKIVFRRTEGWRGDVAFMSVNGSRVTPVAVTPGAEGFPQWLDDERIVLQRVSEDVTTREILIVDVADGTERVVHRDADEKWWSLNYLGAEPRPSPDGRWIAFLADRSGWNHVYLVSTDEGADVVQVTSGEHEYSDLTWAPDGARLMVSRNDSEQPGVRHLTVVDLQSAPTAAVLTDVTSGRGTNTAPVWSPDGNRIAYQHTDPKTSPEIFVTAADANADPVQMTSSMPESLDRDALIEPELVRYPAEDGSEVPAYLFVSPDLDRSRAHPAVVWIHGDGINQNYDGWHIQRNYAVYYSFHQYLAQRGYVVLAVDYRGSIGYGKEWRQGHFRDLGGKDYLDVAAGVDFLGSLGYVDTDRVGVWGLSYGGFMTLQALTVTPDLFRSGINVAGVADWRTWHRDPGGPWIQGRMGSPDESENEELYQRTASIEFMDRLERPLLVMHGTADVNVPFTESVRLVDVLTKLGKDYEFVMYPGEFHYFHREHILHDAWRRAERFFDEHLRD